LESMAGMTTPVTIPASSKSSSKKRPWLQASLKVDKGEGSLNWSNITVYYKVSGSATGAILSLRADNRSPSAINNLTISWKGRSDTVSFGCISPGQSAEGNAGPFALEQVDCALEVKGALSLSDGSKVPIKVNIPATFHLNPCEGLTQDAVMSELSSGSWSTNSIKLDLQSVEHKKAKSILISFFRAAEVEPVTGPFTGTLAANSLSGQKVRVLIKVNDSVVKVDIKSTDSGLGKSLASDLKRIVL
jgi:hypothetical protein